jgi:hypothetical protein
MLPGAGHRLDRSAVGIGPGLHAAYRLIEDE